MNDILFTTSTCPNCPEAKQFVINNNLNINIIELDDPKNSYMMKGIVQELGIRQVPMFVINNEVKTLDDMKKNFQKKF